MPRLLAHHSLAQPRNWLVGLATALIAAAVITPTSANAAARYRPPCAKGELCFFQHVKWNRDDVGTAYRYNWLERYPNRTFYLNIGVEDTLVNRVSSYANFTSRTYCVYDKLHNGRLVKLWSMRPGSSSARVGATIVRGKTVNDRADYFARC